MSKVANTQNANANANPAVLGAEISGRWFDGKRSIATGEVVLIKANKYHIKLTENYSKKFTIGTTMKLFQVNCWNSGAGEESPDNWEEVGRWRPAPSGKKRGTKISVNVVPEIFEPTEMDFTAKQKIMCLNYLSKTGLVDEENIQLHYDVMIYQPQQQKINEENKKREIEASEKAKIKAEEAEYMALCLAEFRKKKENPPKPVKAKKSRK